MLKSIAMFFSLDIPVVCWSLLGVATLCAVFLLTYYRGKIAAIYRHSRQCGDMDVDDCRAEAVSVIVYCDDNPSGLEKLLKSLMTQRYGAPYEVIVVNDGSSESVKDVFNIMSQEYHNLYQTFIPGEAHNLSRRKLAMTLGVKAARNNHLLFLNSSSTISSPHWLSAMARHFASGKEVVIGHAVYDKSEDLSVGKRLRSFDTAADAVTYLSAALAGRPYRGHLENMGFDRVLFFRRNGFAGSLNLHNGIDDIFIGEIATGDNTAVELSSDSIVTLRGESPRRAHRRWKRAHRFTGKYVPRRERRMFGLCSALLWTGSLTALGSALLSLPNLLPAVVAVIIGAAVWIVVARAWRRTIIALWGRRLALTLPWLVMTRPFYNMYYGLVARRHRHENFTWSKLRG